MINSESVRESDELFLDLAPNGRRRVNNCKMIDVFHCDELHVLTRFLFLFSVAVAELVRNVFVGSAMNKDLLRTNVQFRGRRFAVVVRHLGWRAAEKTCGGIITQVQLPAATQVEHAGKRECASDRWFVCSKTECKLAAGRVSGNAEAVAIERRKFLLTTEKKTKSGANVFERPWPSSTGIANATVLNIAGGDSRQLKSVA